MLEWKNVVLNSGATIREAMRIIDQAALRIALICDEKGHLQGTITDGDIRRGLLLECGMEDSAAKVMNTKPKVAKVTHSRQQRLELMEKCDLLSLPIVDDLGHLIGLETLHTALQPVKRDNPIFIMAGGFGTRLRPLTDHCPKPMLRVGDKPMLAHLIHQFIAFGFHQFYISTHYMPEQIRDYFGDGSEWNVSINYVHEDSPLGTGGALGLLPKTLPQLPLIMMNGDVLTKVDFVRLLEHHEQQKFDATMCVRELEHQVPFGVIESKDELITDMVEKPTYRYSINTGIYVLSPECVASVKADTKIDLPTLLGQRMAQQEKVGIYTSYDYWLDIGRMSDYQKAQQDIKGFLQ
ncbi:nucleotidyltransferase family protein [Oceanisphaera pacifica]|uniref:Nucleotidyltransferase family protein n=1 Tax=Oceanisphaera pacifica TaxID=2818389 RepID=A0ABS3NHF4_9GAMM|nr:nucleotidyltransferase family protein [Oceanisphaera pacifica]MBO1519720.1 nucleotidyltransferase family protein [Oceanisphaera pacifica]